MSGYEILIEVLKRSELLNNMKPFMAIFLHFLSSPSPVRAPPNNFGLHLL